MTWIGDKRDSFFSGAYEKMRRVNYKANCN